MNTGWSLGRWFGIAVRLHWSVALIAVFLGAGMSQRVGIAPAVVGVVGFLASILAHEFAHALTARRYGVGTESIQLWALGGVARLDREAPTARAEGWIAAAGPIGSLVVGVASIGLWWLLGGPAGDDVYVALLGWLAVLNALVAVFNLLPGAPLDGGRVVKAVRWAVHGDRYRAAVEAGRAGVVLGWVLVAAGAGLMLSGASGVWLLVTGLFILATAKVEIAGAQLSSRLAGTKVRDLTWFGVAAADGQLDADAMLWDRRRLGRAGGVAIVDEGGTPLGIVLEDQLWAVPAEQRPWVALTQLMVPFDQTARVGPDDELTSVLPKINPTQPMITVWDAGRLVGMVNPATMRERLRDAGW